MAENASAGRAGVSAGLARNSAIGLFGYGLHLLTLVVTLPFLVRAMGPERYGLYILLFTGVIYFQLLDGGLHRATVTFVSEALARGRPEELPGLLRTAARTSILMGLGAGLLFAVVGPPLLDRVFAVPPAMRDEMRRAFLWAGATLPPTIVGFACMGFLEGQQRFGASTVSRAAYNVLQQVVPLAGALAGAGLPEIAGLLALKNLLCMGLAWAACRKGLPPAAGAPTPSGFALLAYGYGTVLLGAYPLLAATLDRVLIGSRLPPAALSDYVVPQQITNGLFLVPSALAAAMLPAFTRLWAAGSADLQAMIRRALTLLLLGMSAITFVLVSGADEILALWMGSAWRSRGALLALFACSLFLSSLTTVFAALLQAAGHAKRLAPASGLLILLQAGLTWFLLRERGLIGAATAGLLTQGVGVVLFAALVRAAGVRFREVVNGKVLALSAVLGALAFGLFRARRELALSPVLFAAAVALPLAAYLVLVWRSSLTAETRRELLALVFRR